MAYTVIMKRWAAVGLLLMATLLFGLLLNRPVDPVERHRRAFKAAHRKLLGITWFTPVEKIYRKVTGTKRKALPVKRAMELQVQMSRSRDALIELGYLAEREFALTNMTAHQFMVNGKWLGPMVARIPRQRAVFCSMASGSQTDCLRVVALPEDMPVWEDLIRKADVLK